MDTSQTYIKMSDCPEIQDTRRYKAFSDSSPSAGALILDDHDCYGVHEDGQYYPDSTVGSHNVWNATVHGYVSNVPSFGCAVQGNRRITYKLDEVIWLPRQDQLQEMVINWGRGQHLAGLLVGLSIFADDNPQYNDSFEQLWLAYVMKEKYNKIWDGEKWGG